MKAMNIEISSHASERIFERVGTSDPNKQRRLAEKAYLSEEPVDVGELTNYSFRSRTDEGRERTRKYRKLMGRIYVFAVYEEKIVLVTVAPVNIRKRKYGNVKRQYEGEKRMGIVPEKW